MNKKWLSAPYLVWAVGFIIIPLLMIFWYGFTDRSGSFTMENVLAILTHEHAKALWLSILLSLVSTVIWALYWIGNARSPLEPVLGLFCNFAAGLPLVLAATCIVKSQL